MKAVLSRRLRKILIHSDQGLQYGSDAWGRFRKDNYFEPSMGRRANCWDNAVAEADARMSLHPPQSFFNDTLKHHLIHARIRDQLLELGPTNFFFQPYNTTSEIPIFRYISRLLMSEL